VFCALCSVLFYFIGLRKKKKKKGVFSSSTCNKGAKGVSINDLTKRAAVAKRARTKEQGRERTNDLISLSGLMLRLFEADLHRVYLCAC
jgi:hypothetical protein